jgi:hypothetical protein
VPYIALVFSGPKAKKCAPWVDLRIVLKVGAGNMHSPLVLAVLGDRSLQHLILGILQRQTCQQLARIGPDMGGVPSRHLRGLCELAGWRTSGGYAPPLMIMRTITHAVVSVLGKDPGQERWDGRGAAT